MFTKMDHLFSFLLFLAVYSSDIVSGQFHDASSIHQANSVELGDASDYTKLYLYTRQTDFYYTEIIYQNISSITDSAFNTSKSTKILIHGWLDTSFNHAELELRHSYMANQDVNMIAVDWRKTADNIIYPIARDAVVPVGKFLAQVVDWMVSEVGVPLDSIHIIGHSLGAHVGGVIGEHVTVGQIRRISGLDPAGPLFGSSTSGRLDPSDAQFVDVVHTCGGLLGWFKPCGHVDFYPNRGTYNQPGCSLDFGKCSHIRSYKLFAESIGSTGFVSTPCDSWSQYKEGVCNGNTTVVMGEYVDMSARGTFYLKTASSSPYALG